MKAPYSCRSHEKAVSDHTRQMLRRRKTMSALSPCSVEFVVNNSRVRCFSKDTERPPRAMRKWVLPDFVEDV
ncbi:MAG TPA: hypothetical protein PLK42_10305, partial [Casimicrobium sp.]|nr:hypothetical protein [Casimicrobium sp.]